MKKADSVVQDRGKYIGGSDIPILMEISPFKRRWDLLMEKVFPENRQEITSPQIEYGNEMEPVIRDYVNEYLGKNFVPDVKIVDDLRGNCDGLETDSILEVKTTSQIHSDVAGYKHYIVQLLFYMDLYKKSKGYLAVYERPRDYSKEFDPSRLQIFLIKMDDYQDWMDEVNIQVDRFRDDLDKVRENPLLTEQELYPRDLVVLGNQIERLEKDLTLFKQMQTDYDNLREKMYQVMKAKNTPKWTTSNGVKFTLIADGEDKIVKKFDEKAFKADHLDIYKTYLKDELKKGSKGYVRVTVPKKVNRI